MLVAVVAKASDAAVSVITSFGQGPAQRVPSSATLHISDQWRFRWHWEAAEGCAARRLGQGAGWPALAHLACLPEGPFPGGVPPAQHTCCRLPSASGNLSFSPVSVSLVHAGQQLWDPAQAVVRRVLSPPRARIQSHSPLSSLAVLRLPLSGSASHRAYPLWQLPACVRWRSCWARRGTLWRC